MRWSSLPLSIDGCTRVIDNALAWPIPIRIRKITRSACRFFASTLLPCPQLWSITSPNDLCSFLLVVGENSSRMRKRVFSHVRLYIMEGPLACLLSHKCSILPNSHERSVAWQNRSHHSFFNQASGTKLRSEEVRLVECNQANLKSIVVGVGCNFNQGPCSSILNLTGSQKRSEF